MRRAEKRENDGDERPEKKKKMGEKRDREKERENIKFKVQKHFFLTLMGN